MNKATTRIAIKKYKKSSYYLWGFLTVFTLTALLFTLWWVKDLFKIKDIYIYGNQQLKSDDIKSIAKINKGDKLFSFPLSELYKRLKSNPWIKEAEIRRELSGVIHIKIKEATPIAILSLKEQLFLIDLDGQILEELSEKNALFLPLLMDIDPTLHSSAYKEAISFVRFINERRLFSSSGSIHIFGHRPEELSLKIDNLTIKIGAGNFDQKLSRLDFVRQEMIKRNIPADTIDLRFSNKIIVKPNESVENAKKKATR